MLYDKTLCSVLQSDRQTRFPSSWFSNPHCLCLRDWAASLHSQERRTHGRMNQLLVPPEPWLPPTAPVLSLLLSRLPVCLIHSVYVFVSKPTDIQWQSRHIAANMLSCETVPGVMKVRFWIMNAVLGILWTRLDWNIIHTVSLCLFGAGRWD